MRWSFSVAKPVFESGQPLPVLVLGRWAATRACVQVFAAARAQPAAVVPAHHPPGHGEHQLLPHRGPEIDLGRIGLQRSEEHTSELQSLAYLVCRLLLEKKKKSKNYVSKTR